MNQQPSRCGKTESGTYTDVPYEGISEAEARTLSIFAESSGILYDWDSTHGKHTVTFHYPFNYRNGTSSNEPPVILWELIEQKAEKSILDSENPLANACTQGELYLLGVFQQNKADYVVVPNDESASPTLQSGTIAYFDVVYDVGQSSPKKLAIAAGSAARTLANLIALGVQTFPVVVPQLKYTQTVNAQYPIKTPFVNVGDILTTQAMYRNYNIPDNVLFILPDYLNPVPTSGKPELKYGWYVNAPQVNQIARLKFQVLQTFEYGLWPVAVFGEPVE